MEQEKILALIFNKLDNIEKGQQKTNDRLSKIEDDQKEIKQDLKQIKSIQENIKEFVLSTEKAIEVYEQDYKFIEKLKRVAGE